MERTHLGALPATNALTVGMERLGRHEKGVEECTKNNTFGPRPLAWYGVELALLRFSDEGDDIIESYLGFAELAFFPLLVIDIESWQRDVSLGHDDRETTSHLPSLALGSLAEVVVHASGIITASGDEIDVRHILHLHHLDETKNELRHSPGIDREHESQFLVRMQDIVRLPCPFIGNEVKVIVELFGQLSRHPCRVAGAREIENHIQCLRRK